LSRLGDPHTEAAPITDASAPGLASPRTRQCGIKIPGKKLDGIILKTSCEYPTLVAAGRQSQKAIWAKGNVSLTT
jgi:hypothetical protein